VADRLQAQALVLVAGMIPVDGEAPADWWDSTGYRQAVEEQAQRDGGKTGSDDPFVAFYHDVPRALAGKALSKERSESQAAYNSPWPLAAWPDVPTRFVLCTEDRSFPPAFLRKVVSVRLGVTRDEIAAGHCVALSRPRSWRTCWSVMPSASASLTRGPDSRERSAIRLDAPSHDSRRFAPLRRAPHCRSDSPGQSPA
jgi:Alpha/beta hydrolase family